MSKRKDAGRKTVIVTGGAQGIGRAIAQVLGNSGYQVVAFDIAPPFQALAKKQVATSVEFMKVDISKEAEVKRAIAAVNKRHGNIYGLVNNAAIANPKEPPLEKLPFALWQRYLDINVTGTFLCLKHCIPHLRKSRGSVVNVSSTRAFMAEPDTESYCTTKGAMHGLTYSAAMSLGPEIRVNVVCPGWIDTSEFSHEKQKISQAQHKQHPVGRVGKPEDIAHLVEFLLSEKSGNITGAQFVSDGGMSRKMIYI